MADLHRSTVRSQPEFLTVLRRIEIALNDGEFPSFCLKPLQVKCFEYIFKGHDVIGVLPTGFGKSLLFHLLPKFLPVKTRRNIVLVVCPLNSIIEDQLKVLKNRGVSADVLQLACDEREVAEALFPSDERSAGTVNHGDGNEEMPNLKTLSDDLVNGNTSLVFAHPEALLSKEGRQLMGSKVFQENVVACVVDEAHCVELW